MSDEVWYRYEDVAYAVLSNGQDDRWHSRLEVELRTYPVLRRTPKGVWLDIDPCDPFGRFDEPTRRFVLTNARRRFACPTLEEAKASFIARKRAQIRIYEARAARAWQAIAKLDWIAFEALNAKASAVRRMLRPC